MTGYNRDTQRQYDNQSPDESGDERDEAIAEQAEVIVDRWVDDEMRVADALDNIAAQSDIGSSGSTLHSELIARILCAPFNSAREREALGELMDSVREYLMRDAETQAATEYDASHLPRNFKGEE